MLQHMEFRCPDLFWLQCFSHLFQMSRSPPCPMPSINLSCAGRLNSLNIKFFCHVQVNWLNSLNIDFFCQVQVNRLNSLNIEFFCHVLWSLRFSLYFVSSNRICFSLSLSCLCYCRDHIRLAIVLALYDKYLKIPSIWKRANANADILNYDGLKKVCSDDGHQHEQSSYGGNWKEYLHLKPGAILN